MGSKGQEGKTNKTLTELAQILEKKLTGADLNSSLKELLGNHSSRMPGIIE